MLKDLLSQNKKEKTLFCFSPEIMFATFAAEFLLAIYTFIKYRSTKFGRAITLTLIFLGLFQIAEFQICRGNYPLVWSKIGLFSITLLPILGLYLISLIDKKTWLLYLGYILSAAFAIYFIFVSTAVENAICGGNYVIFDGQEGLYTFYGFYYFGFLLLAIWESYQRMMKDKKNKIIRNLLFWFIMGYLSFILPLTLVYIFIASARPGVASIMCGFAIVFAFILALKVAPLYQKLEASKKK